MDTDGSDDGSGGGADAGGDDGVTAGSSGGPTGGTAGPGADELPAPSTRFYRLSHEQWENTVQDLFWLAEPTGYAESFRIDSRNSGYIFANNGASLSVDQSLSNAYRTAAIGVAELAVGNEPLKNQLIGGVEDSEQFIRTFGRRAFRRQLSEQEVAEYQALFVRGPEFYEGVPAFDAGLRVVIEAMLQSPHFLYRIETSAEPQGDTIPLSSDEVASRLSYFLWNSMPDAELFQAADADTLRDPANIELQARRMLDDPRAGETVRAFHESLFDASKFDSLTKMGAPENLGELATEEFQRFVRDAVFAGDGGLRELLTSNRSYVNNLLAEIYGVEGEFGSEFVEVDLPANTRRGVLTQVAFLAGHATETTPDPIHRGIFVFERLTCGTIPPPPDNIPALPAQREGKTNRELIEEATEAEGSVCAGCHTTYINPFGFPFEYYGPAGRFRSTDNGKPVDGSSSVLLDGQLVPVGNVFEFVDALADSPKVHECYAKHLVEFANGRPEAESDEAMIERLATESLEGGASVKQLLLAIATSPTFRTRALQELD